MISLEVRRTLVKSPPELWAELSDPDRLARHLRELGDIRIVGTDPEQMVEWEAQGARGSVFLKPSGWGTKVTLTVLRELGEPANPATSGAPSEPGLPASEPGPPASEPPTDPEPPLTPEAAFEPGPPVTTSTLTDPEPGATFVARAEPEPPVTTEVLTDPYPEPAARSEAPLQSEPPAHETEPEPRRGFFARLFGRRGGRAGPEAEGP